MSDTESLSATESVDLLQRYLTWRVRVVDDDWRVAAQMVERFTDLNDNAKRLFATLEEGLNR